MDSAGHDQLRELRIHALDILREAVRDDNDALRRLTAAAPGDLAFRYVVLARMAADALQVATHTPLDVIDVIRRDLARE